MNTLELAFENALKEILAKGVIERRIDYIDEIMQTESYSLLTEDYSIKISIETYSTEDTASTITIIPREVHDTRYFRFIKVFTKEETDRLRAICK